MEWFSFQCRKTKTKVITLASHIGHRQYIEPIKTRSNYIGFGLTSDWMKRWRESFKKVQNQLLFDTQMKTALTSTTKTKTTFFIYLESILQLC